MIITSQEMINDAQAEQLLIFLLVVKSVRVQAYVFGAMAPKSAFAFGIASIIATLSVVYNERVICFSSVNIFWTTLI